MPNGAHCIAIATYLLFFGNVSSVCAEDVTIDPEKGVFVWPEIAGIHYNVPEHPGHDMYSIGYQDPYAHDMHDPQTDLGFGSETIARDYNLDLGAGVWFLDTSTLFGSSWKDPRPIIEAFVAGTHSTGDGSSVWLSDRAKFIVLRPLPPRAGAIDLKGLTRFAFAANIPGTIADNPSLGIPPGTRYPAKLLRPGVVVPGGAVEVDEFVRDGAYAPDGYVLRLDELSQPPGRYEVQLVGPGDAVIDRKSIEIFLPRRLPGAIKLGPPTNRSGSGLSESELPVGMPYDFDHPPTVEVNLSMEDGRYVASSFDLDLYRVVGDGALQQTNQRPWRREPYGAANEPAFFEMPQLEPGHYILQLKSPHTSWAEYGTNRPPSRYAWRYVLDSAAFDIGGTLPTGYVSLIEPELDFGEVTLSLEPSAKVNGGTPMAARIVIPPDHSIGQHELWGELVQLSGYTYECREYGQSTVSAVLVVEGDHIVFDAPGSPGRYELRLYRSVLAHRSGPGSQGQMDQMLARVGFDVIVEPIAEAVQLTKAQITPDDPVEVTVEIPAERFVGSFELELRRAPDVLPGGTEMLTPQHVQLRPAGQTVNEIVPIHEPHAAFRFEPLKRIGNYELRLFQIGMLSGGALSGDRFGVAHALLSVTDPTAPPFPTGSEPRLPSVTDWPQPDDRQRGIESIWMPYLDCAEVQISEPPTFRFVKWRGWDDSSHTDIYEPIEGAFYGYPFLIEALFQTPPSEHEYRLILNDGKRVTITRTADPKVYRSGLLVLTREQPH